MRLYARSDSSSDVNSLIMYSIKKDVHPLLSYYQSILPFTLYFHFPLSTTLSLSLSLTPIYLHSTILLFSLFALTHPSIPLFFFLILHYWMHPFIHPIIPLFFPLTNPSSHFFTSFLPTNHPSIHCPLLFALSIG